MIIPHSRPTLDQDDINAVVSILNGGLIADGQEVKRFENDVAQYIGIPYCVATNSGTSALHLALRALETGRGDSVILPSYVCASVLHAVNYTGATPLLADIEMDGYNIDSRSMADKINIHTKAVIVPHMFGIPAEVDAIKQKGLYLIEDCAQAFGIEHNGKKLGSYGDVAVFSFKATKLLTTGHGGMVATASKSIYDRLKQLTKYDEQNEYHVAYNYEMTDFQAALGRSQLAKFHTFIKRRQHIQRIYDELFTDLGQKNNKTSAAFYFRYVVEVDEKEHYIEHMKRLGITCTMPVFKTLHQYMGISEGFPNTDRAMRRALSIPLYPSLRDGEIEYICESIRKVWNNCGN